MQPDDFVQWFRQAAPYIHAFRGKTFVIALGGEVVRDGRFFTLTHDINLLTSLAYAWCWCMARGHRSKRAWKSAASTFITIKACG